jgi:hypothetical protein
VAVLRGTGLDETTAWQWLQLVAETFELPLALLVSHDELISRHAAAERAWFDTYVAPLAVTA